MSVSASARHSNYTLYPPSDPGLHQGLLNFCSPGNFLYCLPKNQILPAFLLPGTAHDHLKYACTASFLSLPKVVLFLQLYPQLTLLHRQTVPVCFEAQKLLFLPVPIAHG